jgi:hypothetical protein
VIPKPGALVAVFAVTVALIAATPVAASAAPPQNCRLLPVDVDPVLHSDAARAEFGVDGTGIKVGVISNSFDANATYSTAAQNVQQGLLPGPGNPCGYETPVAVLSDLHNVTPTPDDEGRAMLQQVHGVAPGAALYFATAGADLGDLTGAITLMRNAGVDVIIDDVIPLTEPFYQESLEAQAIADAVASGITYVTAAGNNTLLARNPGTTEVTPVGSWETTAYRPAPCDPGLVVPAVAGYTSYDCLDFDPGLAAPTITSFVTLPAANAAVEVNGRYYVSLPVAMQWAEPFGESKAKFEMLISLDGAAPLVVPPDGATDPLRAGSFAVDVTDKRDPTDLIPDEVTMDISIVRYLDGTSATDITPPLGFVFGTDGPQWIVSSDIMQSQGPDTVGRSIAGHNGAPAAITTAASGAFDDDRLDYFSSLGPVTYYVTPEGATPAGPLPQPQPVGKPDLLSVDGARQNVMVGAPTATPGVFLFYGTSAAAPSAGAVAALALQLNPQLSPAEIRSLLVATAAPQPSPYPLLPAAVSVGAGLIDARAMLDAVEAALPVPDPDNPAPRPVLAASGGGDAASAGIAALALVALGAVLVTVRGRRRRAS